MKFLIDNQLPLALVRFLSERGFECRHVIELGLAQESDSRIWRYAVDHEMVIISKDEDFFHLAAQPGAAAQFVWVRMGNCRKDVRYRNSIWRGPSLRNASRPEIRSWRSDSPLTGKCHKKSPPRLAAAVGP